MSEIKSVAIAGASGDLGTTVVKALIDAKFQVTVLTRSAKPGAFDASVKVIEVDYASVESLTAALQGIDGLVSTVGHSAIPSQTVLIDAAVAAGVKRFIPSEFGSVTTNPNLVAYPVYAEYHSIKQALQAKAEAGQMSWTIVRCGAFLEFVFDSPMALNWGEHKATLLDEGDNRFSSTSLLNIGKTVAGIFVNPEATKNRAMKVSQLILTQNELLSIAQEVRTDIKWEVSKASTSAILKAGLESARAGEHGIPTMMKILTGTSLAGDTYGAAYYETDNELFGIKELTKDDLKKRVAEKLA
ncbi:Oxidoreductase swnR [Lachnellula suecica]|uniref:Oxidoreductase swnR n=1 Tax=Lachnellula suecica TaxID=602035 RepID=A0A8T9CPQ4_9HELO|nr:Oxidoreductase swnR [Lachnellula suecica]